MKYKMQMVFWCVCAAGRHKTYQQLSSMRASALWYCCKACKLIPSLKCSAQPFTPCNGCICFALGDDLVRLYNNASHARTYCQVAVLLPTDDKLVGDQAIGLHHDQHTLLLAGQQASLGQEEWPHQGHLQFCGVSLRYGRGLPDALHGVCFELKPGQKVGICGRTGRSEKSISTHNTESA